MSIYLNNKPLRTLARNQYINRLIVQAEKVGVAEAAVEAALRMAQVDQWKTSIIQALEKLLTDHLPKEKQGLIPKSYRETFPIEPLPEGPYTTDQPPTIYRSRDLLKVRMKSVLKQVQPHLIHWILATELRSVQRVNDLVQPPFYWIKNNYNGYDLIDAGTIGNYRGYEADKAYGAYSESELLVLLRHNPKLSGLGYSNAQQRWHFKNSSIIPRSETFTARANAYATMIINLEENDLWEDNQK